MKYNNIKYNILEKNINYKNIFNKSEINYKKENNIYKNIIKTFLFKKYNTNKYIKEILFNSSKDKLSTINKLFEGRHLKLNTNLTLYKIMGILKYNNYINTIIIISLNNILKTNLLISDNYITNITMYKNSLITFPLSLNDISNINNYIYYIYKFIYYKNYNIYKSNIISLFYYFIGIFLSLFSLYFYNNIKIVYSNLIIISMKLSNFSLIEKVNKFTVEVNYIYNIKILNIINNSIYLSNNILLTYRPYLIGLTSYTLISTGILSKLSFQETLRTLQNIILNEKIEWSVDTKSSLITSDFISVGSGWYRYFIN
ncbi:hypothetical protein BcabD6B2_59070 (apicoplast) [Babesia caballi]|uniref:Uncharacterized protein n=1 Tax=Babesia caballi TaxID=5871 RepID=A0AAV4M3P9_BABCB|nr:hypothetical protein BcabD6B2_59070 [Babesia caballi]